MDAIDTVDVDIGKALFGHTLLHNVNKIIIRFMIYGKRIIDKFNCYFERWGM